MPRVLDSAEIARRTTHVLGLLFTACTAAGIVAAAAVRVAGGAAAQTRERAVLVASVAWLVLFAGPLVALLAVLWLGAVYVAVEFAPRPLAPLAVVGLLGALVVAPVWAIARLDGGYVREFVAFASNMVLLRAWGYAWDRRHARAARPTVSTFLASMLFFPTFVNGPVAVPRQMEEGRLPLDAASGASEVRAGARRIAIGCAKLLAVGLGLAPGWTAHIAAMTDAPALRLWGASALLYVWFFLSFSAWSDVAIGLALVCGQRVPENFAAPWLATDPADFWRRWHTSFGRWLRDYVYIPLGGNRRRRARNVAATFLVSAAWHVWGTLKLLGFGYYPVAAWGGFLVWGLLHAGGVLAAPGFARLARGGTVGVAAARAATFLFAALCWLPFFLPATVPLARGLRMMARMLCPWL